jgi:hypothetical protein
VCIKFAIDEQILGTRIPTHVILYFYVCSNMYEKLLNLRLEVAFSLRTSQLQPLLKYLPLESLLFRLWPSPKWRLKLIAANPHPLRRFTLKTVDCIKYRTHPEMRFSSYIQTYLLKCRGTLNF